MLPLSERQLRLAKLDPNSSTSLAQPCIAPQYVQKHRTSVAAGAPLTKKKSLPKTENLLSKTVASLSSEMAEMKRLLQSLQPLVPTAPTKTVSVNESDFQPPDMIDLDALSMSASNSHFLDEELVDSAMQSGPPQDALSSLSAAGGSSGGSVHSSSAGQSSPDDILSILQMATAHLGLDRSVQPAQSNVFFRQKADTMFTMPQWRTVAASHQMGPPFSAEWPCLGPRSSSSPALGLASGSTSQLTDCEPAGLNTIGGGEVSSSLSCKGFEVLC
ncbi:hypothetical protein G5714_005362 [Onychostoma macrolepis]|uniref:Uncharacterized protein n=1 Tax=Onychostoma macrolepis TaxID=369639 RepID=A0A7J6D0T4_9TELE|nr:hypothetical protein G5714_005362 [Onychostoma macrolepis]